MQRVLTFLGLCSLVLPVGCGGKSTSDGSSTGADSTGESGDSDTEGTESGDGTSDSSDSGEESSDTDDTGDLLDLMGEPACEDLDEEACDADPDCESVVLNSVIQDFIGNEKWCIAPDTAYLGCRDADTDCPPEVIVVCEDENGPFYYAPDGCLPPGPDWMVCDSVGDLPMCS